MQTHIIGTGLVVGTLWFAAARAGDEPKAEKEVPLPKISLDVQALRAFYTLKLTDDQLKLVAKLAKETAEPERQRAQPKASAEVRRVLTELSSALADGSDDDKIGDLEDEVDQAIDKEKPQLDDSFDVTTAARQRTPQVIESMKADQLAAYYGSLEDEVLEPLPYLITALDKVRGMDKSEWRDKRDEIADEIAWAVAGVDAAKAEKVSDKTVALLSKARSLGAGEYKSKKTDLEQEAKRLVGAVSPDEVLRHHAEHTVADMLSNPRLEAAIQLKLK